MRPVRACSTQYAPATATRKRKPKRLRIPYGLRDSESCAGRGRSMVMLPVSALPSF